MKSSIFDVLTVVTVMLVLVLFSGTVNPVMAQNAYGRQDLTFENDSGNGNGHDQGKSGRRAGHSDNMPGQRNGHRKDVVDQTAGDTGSGEGVSEPPTGAGQQGFQRRGFRKPPMRGFGPGQNNNGEQGNNECGQQYHRRPFMRRQPMPFAGRGRCQPDSFKPGNNGFQQNNPGQGAKGDNGKHLGWRNRGPQRDNANINGQPKPNNEGNGAGNAMEKGNNGLHLGWRNNGNQGRGAVDSGRIKQGNGNNGIGNAKKSGKK